MRLPSRRFVSACMGSIVVLLMISGVWLWMRPYSSIFATLHTLTAFVVLPLMLVHLTHNGPQLLRYWTGGVAKTLSAGLILFVLVTSVLQLPPASSIKTLGQSLRGVAGFDTSTLTEITTGTVLPDIGKVTVHVQAGDTYESEPRPLFLGLTYTSTPQMAIWLETLDGTYLQSLYVTASSAEGSFINADFASDEIIRRPEALPVWSHKRGIKYDDGLMMPTRGSVDLDGYTSATPIGHYRVDAKLQASDAKSFRVMMELNRSYDFNDYWHVNKYPDDATYSGSGASGQPSLIYTALVSAADPIAILRPIGHGHHSGQDGLIRAGLEGFDSALQLIDFALVQLELSE